MARVHVVCDASFDEKLHFAGYAGDLYIDPEHHSLSAQHFSGVIGECADIHQAEIFAITAGLITLRDLEEKNHLTIHDVVIHTDSITAIDEWVAAQRGIRKHPAYTKLVDRGQHLIEQRQWRTVFSHVHSHVPNEIASPIERLHNRADLYAKQIREQAVSHLCHPNITKPMFYAAVLPASPKNQQEADLWYHLSQTLCQQDKHGRIYIQGGAQQSHPFLAGINDYAQTHNVQRLNLARQLLFNSHQPINGLDLTLARYWWSSQHQTNLPLLDHDTLQHASIACRLLLGDADSGFLNTSEYSGRLQPPSYTVFDLTGESVKDSILPHSTVEWINTFSPLLSIPRLDTPEVILSALTPEHKQSSSDLRHHAFGWLDPDGKLFSALLQIHSDFSGQVEKHQWIRMMAETIMPLLPIKNTAMKEAITRYMLITDDAQPEKFIQHVLKHIVKITPTEPTQEQRQHPKSSYTHDEAALRSSLSKTPK